MKPSLRHLYGWHWRKVTRPAILLRAGGSFDPDGRYLGFAHCERCTRVDWLKRGGRSGLDIAHLVIAPGEPGHDDPSNLAALCHKDHRALDYESWAIQYRAWLKRKAEIRIAKNDAERPILVMLDELVEFGKVAQKVVHQKGDAI